MNEPPSKFSKWVAWFQPDVWRARLLRLRGLGRRSLPFVSGVGATLLALILYNVFFPDPQPLSLTEVNESVNQILAEATPLPAYSSIAYQVIRPSIVLIQVEGEKTEENEEGGGLGTGVVVNDQGLILTSLHVVTGANKIDLFFADGTEATGEIVMATPENDTAVVAPSKLPELLIPAMLGSPASLNIGDEVYAVGHPLGLYGSMSAGVVSGFDRTFKPSDRTVEITGLIQFDAAVNPGNSGGPLLNRYGAVVGIVTGLVNPTDENFFIGIGFAVPINVAGGGAGAPPY